MGLDVLKNGVEKIISISKSNPTATTLGALGGAAVLGVGSAAVIGAVKSRKSKRRKSRNTRKRGSRIRHTKRGWIQDRKRRSKQKWEIAYQKRKRKLKKSKRGVHYTKTGQPYIILSSGKARFIKRKKGVRR